MWKKIKTYLRYYFFSKYSISKYDDVPLNTNKYTIYLIEDWSIYFKCPCGCTNGIQLNTLTESSPNWSYRINKNNISIHPSIRRVKGCKSHFWIKKGKVFWC